MSFNDFGGWIHPFSIGSRRDRGQSCQPDDFSCAMRHYNVMSSFVMEIQIVIMPKTGEFGEKCTPNIAKPDTGKAARSLVSANENLRTPSLASQFLKEQRTRMPLAIDGHCDPCQANMRVPNVKAIGTMRIEEESHRSPGTKLRISCSTLSKATRN
jgi:hypothetical protein